MKPTAATGAVLAALLMAATPAGAVGAFTNGVPRAGGPQYPSTIPLTGQELLPADTNLPGATQPQSEAVSSKQLGGFVYGQEGSAWRNGLIGGDFGTNLWQRGTGGIATTATLTYGPDRWWALSGTGTEVKLIREAEGPGGFAASARFQRTASQTGVLPACMGQVLTSANSARFEGQRVEFSLWLEAGANFSAPGSQVSLLVASGTGSDQSAADFSTGSWSGYSVAGNSTAVLTSGWGHYSIVVDMPPGASQVGVKLCWTPSGTAGTDDWVEIAGAQLDVNPAAQAELGVSGQPFSIASFEHRDAGVEARLQYGYFYRLAEPASGAGVAASCQATGASTNECVLNLPVPMRAAGAIAITTAGTFKVNIAGSVTTIASPTAGTCSPAACTVTGANTNTAGQAELLTGGGGSGAWDVSAEL